MNRLQMIWQIAKSAGSQIRSVLLAQPINEIKELRADFWPDDESVDEFIEAVHEQRDSCLLHSDSAAVVIDTSNTIHIPSAGE